MCQTLFTTKKWGEIIFGPEVEWTAFKSGLHYFWTKSNFPSPFVSEKGLAHMYKKAIDYFPFFFIFALLQAKIALWPN